VIRPGDRYRLPSGSIVVVHHVRQDIVVCRYEGRGERGEMNFDERFLRLHGRRA
jgi:hypothetical protein